MLLRNAIPVDLSGSTGPLAGPADAVAEGDEMDDGGTSTAAGATGRMRTEVGVSAAIVDSNAEHVSAGRLWNEALRKLEISERLREQLQRLQGWAAGLAEFGNDLDAPRMRDIDPGRAI